MLGRTHAACPARLVTLSLVQRLLAEFRLDPNAVEPPICSEIIDDKNEFGQTLDVDRETS